LQQNAVLYVYKRNKVISGMDNCSRCKAGVLLLTGKIFTYDTLNRLTDWAVYKNGGILGGHWQSYNPTTGTFTPHYGANGKPHALTSIDGDLSASMNNQAISYTDFKKVKSIQNASHTISFTYGVDEQRIKIAQGTSGYRFARYYMGNYEEMSDSQGNNRKVHYLNGGNGLFAIHVQNNGKDTTYFTHTDYQGSLMALSLYNGTVAERYAYDPWGNRRNPDHWMQTDSRTSFRTNRGYTMHEHLPEFGLINMNGRVYDPQTALFFSPDPYLQAPGDWLNYNRYSYCLNNPMKYTDPDGEFFLMAVFMSAMINTAIQGLSGNLDGIGSFWKAMGIGALSGAIGYGAGALVSGAIQIGGVAGGSLIGAAGGAAGGFVGGAGNAWNNGASFGDGLKAGLIGGGIGAITGGITGGLIRGISDYRNGYDFWDGSRYDDILTGDIASVNGDVEKIADSYNSSFQAEYDTSILQEKMLETYGVKEGDYNIKEITTRTTKGAYGMTTDGKYYKLSTNKIVGGYTMSYSNSPYTSLHVSPHYTNGDIVFFKAVAGHELIHAYHNYVIPNYDIKVSEKVAYKYSVDVLVNNGRFSSAMSLLNTAHGLSYWGTYPSQYGVLPNRLYWRF
jgi:RHS repeat-associated protein